MVVAGPARTGEATAQAISDSLAKLGIESVYLGQEEQPHRIASVVAEERADTVELCLAGGGVPLLRDLLRDLIRIGRRDVTIVVHRVG